jgi:Protein of unknown function (DUF2829)
MDFADAFRAMQNGGKVARAVWNDDRGGKWQGSYLSVVEMPPPFDPPAQMMIRYSGKAVMRAFAGTQWDLMADDWESADDAV